MGKSYSKNYDELYDNPKYKKIPLGAKVLYGFLSDRLTLSEKSREKFTDKSGRIYINYPVQKVCDRLDCSQKSAIKYFKALQEFGLIEKIRIGQGREDKIYVNSLWEIGENSENTSQNSKNYTSKNEDFSVQNSNFYTSGSGDFSSEKCKNYSQEVENLHVLYNDFQTDIIQTNSIHPIYQEEINAENFSERLDRKDELEKNANIVYIGLEFDKSLRDVKERVCYARLVELYPDNKYLDFSLALISKIMTEAGSCGNDIPKGLTKALVKAEFQNIGFTHIAKVLDSLVSYHGEIRNISQFLVTCLYRAAADPANDFYISQHQEQESDKKFRKYNINTSYDLETIKRNSLLYMPEL
jgi:hypothetical protein